jgi:Flp pilus assembly protein TadD
MNNFQLTTVIKALLPCLLLVIGVSFVARSPDDNPSDEVVRYTTTLTVEPDDQTALVNRCGHYISLARCDEAIADCTRSQQLSPNGIHVLQNRATAYQRWGRLPESLADWEQALALMEQDDSGLRTAQNG